MVRTVKLTFGMDVAGKRIDAALAAAFTDISRSSLQGLIRSGAALIDGKIVKPGLKLKGGEAVEIDIPEKEEPETLAPTPLSFPIIYEDEHIVVVDKPAGLVTHPGAGHESESVVSALLSRGPLSPIGAPLRPGVVHRLDKGTSGLMVLAKTEKAHQKLTRAFSSRRVKKEYLALVEGRIVDERGRIEVAIERDRQNRKRMKAAYQGKGKPAVSVFEVLERLSGASLVKVAIETGRTHQIRVHMAFIGHPLKGDVLYGAGKFNGKAFHYLHSHKLEFDHPINGKHLAFEAPIPHSFKQTLESLRNDKFPTHRRR